MKKTLITSLTVIVILSLTVVLAAASGGFSDKAYRVNDRADLLSESEEAALLSKADSTAVSLNFDIAIFTTESLGDYYYAGDYADDLFDYNDFGYGETRDGILLLISMEERDVYISTSGYGLTAFTEDGIDYILDQITPSLSKGDYSTAFFTFVELCEDFVTQARTDKPYTRSTLPREPLSPMALVVCAIIGLVIALIAVGSMKARLHSVRSQAAAGSYVRENSLNITDSRELFLYRKVSRVAKASDSSSRGGGGTHTSSSGRTHGGGGGKF